MTYGPNCFSLTPNGVSPSSDTEAVGEAPLSLRPLDGGVEDPAASSAQQQTGHRRSPIPVTVAVCNYNGGDLARATIAATHELDYPIAEILLVDDGSTDDSVERVRRAFPDVRIVLCGKNVGCPNRARNRALVEAKTQYVFISDNDITFARDVLDTLMAVMQSQSGAAACTPRVLVAEDPGKLHGQGHSLHYLCVSTAERVRGGIDPREPYIGVGGGIQLVDSRRAEEVGLFSEDMVLGWGDDGEFHHRLRMAGYGVYVVPGAHVFHRRIRQTPRFYGYVHNRWTMLVRTYQARTIILAGPALLVFELLFFAQILIKGGLRDYLRAIRDVTRKLGGLRRRRRAVQAIRRVRDRDLLVAEAIDVPHYVLRNRLVRAAVGVFDRFAQCYWHLIRPFL